MALSSFRCAYGLALYHAAYANLPRRFCTFERPEGPYLVQCLGAATGRLVRSRPASAYEFRGAVRTTGGFALSYSNSSALDYTHGVLLIGAAGRDLRDFQRSRTE